MSLATRCPACTTSFRVVQDQLKVSAGWVRCGRCGEVFNALEGLFDLDAEAPAASVQDDGGAPAGGAPPDTPQAAGELQRAEAPDPTPPAPIPAAPAPPPAPVPSPLLPTPVDASFILPAGATLISAAPPAASAPPPAEPEVAAPLEHELSFVRRAERAARWQRPWVRAVLSVLALGLLGGLVGQWLLAERDWVAARWPALQPVLAQACIPLGCQVQPPRRIEQLAVESSGFTRVEGAPLYRLSLVLRNKGDLALALPAVDLTVTDPGGQLVSRRVLLPAELGATQPAIAAGQELPLQALLAAGDRRLAGYSVEIFYP